jgi:hypothetical protein
MVLAAQVGFLEARAEHLASDLDRAEDALRAKPDVQHWHCASTFASQPVTLEYDTYTERDGTVSIELLGVWLRGVRFEFGEQEIAPAQFEAWEKDCERHQGWHYAGIDAEPFESWVDTAAAAVAAEDRFIAQRDHAHYARAA